VTTVACLQVSRAMPNAPLSSRLMREFACLPFIRLLQRSIPANSPIASDTTESLLHESSPGGGSFEPCNFLLKPLNQLCAFSVLRPREAAARTDDRLSEFAPSLGLPLARNPDPVSKVAHALAAFRTKNLPEGVIRPPDRLAAIKGRPSCITRGKHRPNQSGIGTLSALKLLDGRDYSKPRKNVLTARSTGARSFGRVS